MGQDAQAAIMERHNARSEHTAIRTTMTVIIKQQTNVCTKKKKNKKKKKTMAPLDSVEFRGDSPISTYANRKIVDP
jgi:hypothetical protein